MKQKKLVHKPYKKLKGFLREKSLTYSDVASLLGLTTGTVSMKVNGYSDFYLSEQKALEDQYGAQGDIFC